MNSFRRTEPWYATEAILREYLCRARPYLKGRLLDAGCGAQRYRELFDCDSYVGMEYDASFSPDVVGDLRQMPFGDAEFDSILNNQVLEHVDDTHRVFAELQRVLKPGGYLCVTVPFVARTHEVPHDYWRFSEYGLRYLFGRHGFEEVEIRGMGGFLTTQAYLWQFWIWEGMGRWWRPLRGMRRLLMLLTNPLFLIIHRLDRDRTTPFNYFAIARKK